MTTDVEAEVPAAELIRAMPKAELHLHLDGSLRLETIADLARSQGLSLPVSADRLAEVCMASPEVTNLEELLAYYALPLSVLQTTEALERATFELVEDLRAENVRYAEIRFAPALHRQGGMGYTDAIEAVLRGWQTGRERTGIHGGIILCAMRQLPPERNLEVAKAGETYLGRGVVGFDLAGDEANFPILLHREPLLYARAAGYGMTAHAGEGAGAQSVRDAIDGIGVSRIGYGARSGEEPRLLVDLRDRGITLEMCPTSNVQTHAVPSLAQHPLVRFYLAGVRVTVSTDGRTVSDTTLTRELVLSSDVLGVRVRDIAAMTLTAVQDGFAEQAERRALLREMARDMLSLGIGLPPS